MYKKKILVGAIAALIASSQSYGEESNFIGSMKFYDTSGVLVHDDQTVTGFLDASITPGRFYFDTQQTLYGYLWYADIDTLFFYDENIGGVQEFTWTVVNYPTLVADSNNNFIEARYCIRTQSYDGCANILQPDESFLISNGVVYDADYFADNDQGEYYYHTFNLMSSNQVAAGLLWDWSVSKDIATLQVWERTVNSNGSVHLANIDSDGDGVPGTALLMNPFPSQTMVIDGDLFDPFDFDSDGIPNISDNCPRVVNIDQANSDGDASGDACDAFPFNPAENKDSDGDGVGDNADAFPLDPDETMDSDGDGVGNNTDAFPFDPNETVDSDGDGVGDNTDAFPFDPVESADLDSDGVGDNTDNCTLVVNPSQRDTDLDGYGNYCDPDFDNNLVVNAADLAYFKSQFFTTYADADLNGDGLVNAGDLAILKTFFFKSPGPSAIDAGVVTSSSKASSSSGVDKSFNAKLE